jgi:hypothetical protein
MNKDQKESTTRIIYNELKNELKKRKSKSLTFEDVYTSLEYVFEEELLGDRRLRRFLRKHNLIKEWEDYLKTLI